MPFKDKIRNIVINATHFISMAAGFLIWVVQCLIRFEFESGR